MVATGRLVIGVIVLDEPGGIVRKRIDHTAGTLVGTGAIVFGALGGPGLPLGVAGGLIIGAAKVSFARHAGHVIHGGCDGCLDPGIQRRRIDGHAAPPANADDADALGIYHFVGRKEIHGRQEVLRIDVRRRHHAGFTTGFAGKGGIKGNREETSLGHMLRIDAGRLLLYGAKGAGDCDGRQLAFRILGNVQIGSQFNAKTIVESDFAVIDQFGFREGLVPFLGESQGIHILVLVAAEQQHGCKGYGYALFHVAKVRGDVQVFVLIFADFIPISQILLSLQGYEEDPEGR